MTNESINSSNVTTTIRIAHPEGVKGADSLGQRLLACAIACVLLFMVMVLNTGDEPKPLAAFSNLYVIGTAAYQLFFFYFFIAFPVSLSVDSIVYRRKHSAGSRTNGIRLMAVRILGHTIAGFAVGWLLSYPLQILPEFRLNFAILCCLLMLLMSAVDRLLSIRIKRKP